MQYVVRAVSVVAVLVALSAPAPAYQLQHPCDPEMVVATAVEFLSDVGYDPPLDSAGQPVEIHVFSGAMLDDAGTCGEYVDAPSSGMDGPSYINLYSQGMAQNFNNVNAICDVWLVMVILHHEYMHCPGPAGYGFGGDVCGEWAAFLETFQMLCVMVVEWQQYPLFPYEEICAEMCALVKWFEKNQAKYQQASCTGTSGAIPTPCDCECE